MERQWSLVVVLLLAVQARANPWQFGEDHPNFRVIFQISGQIWPFSYNTRQILTIPPCMTLKYVWVKVSNTLGFTPTVKFHKTLNVVSITYGLLQHTGSNYDIVARGFRTPNCNPGVQENEYGYFPYRLKGTNTQTNKKDILQRIGKDYKKALDAVDSKISVPNDDLNNKKYGYDNLDQYDDIKESYEDREDISNKLEEVESEKKRNYMIFVITGNVASQKATGDNGGDIVDDTGSDKRDDADDSDYGNGKDYSHKSSKFIGVDEYSAGKKQAKSGGNDKGWGNAKGVSYRGRGDHRPGKKETNSDGSGFKSDDRNSMVSGYGGSSRHDKDKTGSLGYGKGYGSNNKHENYQSDSYDDDSESYRHTKNKNIIGNIKESRGIKHEGNYKGSYDIGDIRYVGTSGDVNNKEYNGSSGLGDDYLDVFDIGNRNQTDVREKDISLFCSDYLRTRNGRETKNLALDKKVIDYCLFQVGRSNF